MFDWDKKCKKDKKLHELLFHLCPVTDNSFNSTEMKKEIFQCLPLKPAGPVTSLKHQREMSFFPL